MVNRIRSSEQCPAANGESFGINQNRTSKRIEVRTVSSESAKRYVRAESMEEKTASFSVSASDDGKTFIFDDATGSIVATLPKAAAANKDMTVRFIVNALAGAGAGHAVSPNASDKFVGNGFTPLADKDAICVVASDRLGDTIEVKSNGVDTWFITGVIGTWNRE
jgi:hypothetical protein